MVIDGKLETNIDSDVINVLYNIGKDRTLLRRDRFATDSVPICLPAVQILVVFQDMNHFETKI